MTTIDPPSHIGTTDSRTHDQVLRGQWAVVTGGSKGIGYGIATSLLAAGANVVLVARNQHDLDTAKVELRTVAHTGQAIETFACDTADVAAIDTMFERLGERIPAVNIFVANAGRGTFVDLLEVTEAEWNEVISLNLTGTFFCIQGAAKLMLRDSPDANHSIIVTSSIRANGVRPDLVHYATSKAGVNQMAKAAAYELAPRGIRVNVISPGFTITPLNDQQDPEKLEGRVGGIPMGRAGSILDSGAAAVFLASPASNFITGTNIVIDGGESLW